MGIFLEDNWIVQSLDSINKRWHWNVGRKSDVCAHIWDELRQLDAMDA